MEEKLISISPIIKALKKAADHPEAGRAGKKYRGPNR